MWRSKPCVSPPPRHQAAIPATESVVAARTSGDEAEAARWTRHGEVVLRGRGTPTVLAVPRDALTDAPAGGTGATGATDGTD